MPGHDVELAYPSTITRANTCPIWYVDLKDWIGLAKANLGLKSGTN